MSDAYPSAEEDLSKLLELVTQRASYGDAAPYRAVAKLIDERKWAIGRAKMLETKLRGDN